MTSARSLAASVVALGFASTLTAPTPAIAAPAPCERAESYAAQSGAEVLRIEKLEVRTVGAERPTTKEESESAAPALKGAAGRVLGAGDDPTIVDPADSDTVSEGVTRTGEAMLGVLGLKSARSGQAANPSQPGQAAGTGPATATDGHAAGAGAAGDAAPATAATGGKAVGNPLEASPVGRRDGRRRAITNLSVGEARTAMIGSARTKSAAVARVVNGKGELGKPLLQQSPPGHNVAAKRSTPAGQAGPVAIGAGQIGVHARWAAGMACGQTAGEAARSDAAVGSVNVLDGALVRMTERVSSSSRTGLERDGEDARTVATATADTGRIDLVGGKVQIRVLRAPKLAASMSATEQGEVRYQPAVVEVSGEGVQRQRLDTAGEQMEITLRPDRRATESIPLSDLMGVGKAAGLPLPALPDLPSVADQDIESAPAGGPGTRVRVSLGDVRQAAKGHAIAARATAIKVAISQDETTGGRDRSGYGDKPRSTVSLALGVGLLEAAAVAPEKKPVAGASPAVAAVSPAVGGTGGGLPITGPRLDLLAYGGGGLLVAGIIAVVAGTRRRRPRA